jgi:hypothetical protein
MEEMMNRIALVGLALAAACSGSAGVVPADGTASEKVVTTVDGPLRFDVSDFHTVGGIMWTLPQINTSRSTLFVQETRYGSLCQNEITAHADVRPGAIDLHVRYTERFTSCIAEVRALKYDATLTGLSGAYDLTIIHDENGRSDTLMQRKVTVP